MTRRLIGARRWWRGSAAVLRLLRAVQPRSLCQPRPRADGRAAASAAAEIRSGQWAATSSTSATGLLAVFELRHRLTLCGLIAPAGFGRTVLLDQASAEAGPDARDIRYDCTPEDANSGELASGCRAC